MENRIVRAHTSGLSVGLDWRPSFYHRGSLLLILGLLLICGAFDRLSAQIFVAEPIQWQDHVGTTGSYPGSQGSTLTRTAATSPTPAWDADAASTKWIYGDGWVEFRFDQTNKSVAVGLVETNSDRTWTSFAYSIKAVDAGTFGFFEAGVQVGPSSTSFNSTDVFRIERVGFQVTFTRKSSAGAVLNTYTSTKGSQGVLLVDSSFMSVDSSISNCRHFGVTGPEDVLWFNHHNSDGQYTSGSKGSTILKTGTAFAWDADAVSSKALAGNGVLRFRLGQINQYTQIGLATSNPNSSYTSLNYSLLTNGTTINVYELGIIKTGISYTVNDIFSIRRNGTVITYAKNGVVFHTTNDATTANLFVDCSIYSSGAKFTNCQIEGYPLSETPTFVGSSFTQALTSVGATLTATATGGGALTTSFITGDGTLSFSFAQSSSISVEAGFTTSRTPNPPTAASINFGIRGRSDSLIEIIEAGTSQGVYGSYLTTDRFEVRRLNGVIEYLKNGSVLKTTATSQSALSGAFSFNENSGKVTNVVWYSGESDLLWRRPVLSTPDWSELTNGSLTRGANPAGWTASALGSRQLIGDGYVQWKFAHTDKGAMVGLAPSEIANAPANLQYAIYGNGAGGAVEVWENGASVGSYGAFDTTQTFRIRRTGTTIKYSRIDANGAETFLGSPSSIPATTPLVVVAALYDPNVAITNCRVFLSDSDADGLDDQWEIAEFGDLTQAATGSSADPDLDGKDNLHEFYAGSDPADFFNGKPPQLTIVSGNQQISHPDSFLPAPLVVEVRDSSGVGSALLPNVPVRFTVQSGGGALATTAGSSELQTSACRKGSVKNN
jgi:hypothetical protein